MKQRRMNWPLWAGFLLSLAALGSYPLFFAQFPVTRDVPWVNFLLFGTAAVLLAVGLRRAFSPHSLYRGKVTGPILTVASMAVMGFFLFLVLFCVQGSPRLSRCAASRTEGPGFYAARYQRKAGVALRPARGGSSNRVRQGQGAARCPFDRGCETTSLRAHYAMRTAAFRRPRPWRDRTRTLGESSFGPPRPRLV